MLKTYFVLGMIFPLNLHGVAENCFSRRKSAGCSSNPATGFENEYECSADNNGVLYKYAGWMNTRSTGIRKDL